MGSTPSSPRPKRSGHPAEKLLPRASVARRETTTPSATAGASSAQQSASRPLSQSSSQSPTHPQRPNARLHSLDALGALRETLAIETERRAEARALEAERIREAELAANVFRNEIGAVQPLSTPPRIVRARATPLPLPLQTQRDEAAVLTEAISDEFDPECMLEIDESVSFCRPGVSGDVVRKLRRGAWIVQAQIDLHGMRREEARVALADMLRDSVKRGLRCIRVIHGKGLGSLNKQPVLKGKVRAWLVQKEEVIAFCQARPHDGGAGAVVVLLQPGNQLRHGQP
jgi:DNA-nicking Smr family endonuclease